MTRLKCERAGFGLEGKKQEAGCLNHFLLLSTKTPRAGLHLTWQAGGVLSRVADMLTSEKSSFKENRNKLLLSYSMQIEMFYEKSVNNFMSVILLIIDGISFQ